MSTTRASRSMTQQQRSPLGAGSACGADTIVLRAHSASYAAAKRGARSASVPRQRRPPPHRSRRATKTRSSSAPPRLYVAGPRRGSRRRACSQERPRQRRYLPFRAPPPSLQPTSPRAGPLSEWLLAPPNNPLYPPRTRRAQSAVPRQRARLVRTWRARPDHTLYTTLVQKPPGILRNVARARRRPRARRVHFASPPATRTFRYR